MSGLTRAVREEFRQPESVRTESFVQPGFVKLVQGAPFYVRMPSTDSEQLSRRLGDEIERSFISPRVEIAAERVMDRTVESDDILVRLND